MKYNLYLSSVIEAVDDIDKNTICDDLRNGNILVSACNVLVRIEESYLMTSNMAHVTLKVHGLKTCTIDEMASEAKCNAEKLVNLIEDYIGATFSGDFNLNNRRYHIDFTGYQQV